MIIGYHYLTQVAHVNLPLCGIHGSKLNLAEFYFTVSYHKMYLFVYDTKVKLEQ